MQSTSCGDKCPFVKNKMCDSCRDCPNYIETWWIPQDGAQPVKLEDCSPKRLVLQQQVLQSHLDLTTQALVQSRNEYNQLCSHLKSFIEIGKSVILKDNQKKLEESNENNIVNLPDLRVEKSD